MIFNIFSTCTCKHGEALKHISKLSAILSIFVRIDDESGYNMIVLHKIILEKDAFKRLWHLRCITVLTNSLQDIEGAEAFTVSKSRE